MARLVAAVAVGLILFVCNGLVFAPAVYLSPEVTTGLIVVGWICFALAAHGALRPPDTGLGCLVSGAAAFLLLLALGGVGWEPFRGSGNPHHNDGGDVVAQMIGYPVALVALWGDVWLLYRNFFRRSAYVPPQHTPEGQTDEHSELQ